MRFITNGMCLAKQKRNVLYGLVFLSLFGCVMFLRNNNLSFSFTENRKLGVYKDEHCEGIINENGEIVTA